jgi:hypothetical protein
MRGWACPGHARLTVARRSGNLLRFTDCNPRRPVRTLRYLVLALAATQLACDDPFGPRLWSAAPDTAFIYSSSRAEYIGRVSSFDIVELRPVRIEVPGATGQWDFALADGNGALELVPAGELSGGLPSSAAIAIFPNQQLEDITAAPRDTALFRSTAVAVEPNTIYVIRSRRAPCGFGTAGFFYAKMRAVDIDVERGTLRFEVVRNPFCNDRALVPPES